MGQYYTPILFKGNTEKAFLSHQFDTGLKLMEHSYIGNSFTESIVTLHSAKDWAPSDWRYVGQ